MSGEVLNELTEKLIADGVTQGEAAAGGLALGSGLGFVAGGIFATYGIVILILALLLIIARWKIFTKAGEAGWKSIIPIYSTYILFRIAGSKNWKRYLIATILACLAISCVQVLGFDQASLNTNAPVITNAGVAVGGFIAFMVLAIWAWIETIIMKKHLSENFGKGTGFTVGLVLLENLFLLILGFGKSTYQGNK